MKILKSKKTTAIIGGLAATAIVVAASLGFGLGFGLKGSSKPDTPIEQNRVTLDFSTTELGQGYGSVLSASITSSAEVSNFKYVKSLTTNPIAFDGTEGIINITLLLNNDNPIVVTNDSSGVNLFVPISPIENSSITYNYAQLLVANNNSGNLIIFFRGLAITASPIDYFLTDLSNEPTTSVVFSLVS